MKTKIKLCLILALACGFLYAQEAEKGKYDPLAQKVEKKIRDEKKVEIEGLKVSDQDGVIYLEGVANLLGSRLKAEEVAKKVDGVTKVNNQVAVTTGDVQDGEIEATLINKIQSHLLRGPFDLVSVKSNHGFVRLDGIVRDTSIIQKAYDDAIWTHGVREVDNRLQGASIAAGDERLRSTIYNRLRSEYPQYFLGSVPNIIIVVEHGRVALFGSVNSPVEREKIGSTIRSFPGVLSVNNQIQAH